MGEMIARMADEAAGVLQGSERQLCAHFNALAVLTLQQSLQPPKQQPAASSSSSQKLSVGSRRSDMHKGYA